MASSPGTLSLRGNAPDGLADFTVRRDEVVTRATLDLNFTPSPSCCRSSPRSRSISMTS